MSLINDIATLRKFVKVAFTTTERNLPDIADAEREYLLPVLGLDILSSLRDQADSKNVTWSFLLELCRAVVAPLAFYTDLSLFQAQIEESGVKTTKTDNKEAAHQWEYKEIQNTLLAKGSKNLDALIEHLIAKGKDYNWKDLEIENLIFKTGRQFSHYITLNQPNVTFQQLKPIIAEIQDNYIKPGIGEEFFNSLLSVTSPTPEERRALWLISKTVANYSIAKATERLPVKITPNGVLATLEYYSQSTSSNPTATDTRLEILKTSCTTDAETYYGQLKQFLNKTANEEIFSIYKNSDSYTEPAAPLTSGNNSRNGIVFL